MDKGHKWSDKKLKQIENEIDKLYRQAYREIKKEIENYPSWDRILSIKDKNKRLRMAKRRSDYQLLIKHIAKIIQNKNKIAADIILNKTVDIYKYNFDYEAYSIEHISGFNLNYILYSKEAIIELLKDTTPMFTKVAYDNLKDLNEITRDLKRELGVSIIKGESILQIAKRISKVTSKNNYDSTRIARTETTRLSNVGRLEAIKHGSEMGLELKKQWISTIDGRTRERHRELNLDIIDIDKKFSRGLAYPGDPSAPASEVCNCRCTIISVFEGIKPTAKELELDASLKRLSFEEWREKRG